mmetsp:Transcript_10146/g.36064  ORF Transcript_10146/g.36064 Transcript_10146/m.36064 type:complete len:251 (-) Transcript_10146:109-861(-)
MTLVRPLVPLLASGLRHESVVAANPSPAEVVLEVVEDGEGGPAVLLHPQSSLLQLEPAVLSPVRSPAVSSDPVLHAVVRHAPSGQLDVVIDHAFRVLSVVYEDPIIGLSIGREVVHELLRGHEGAGHGPILVNLPRHLSLSPDLPERVDAVSNVGNWEAGVRPRVAVGAHGATLLVPRQVGLAALVWHRPVLHHAEDVPGLAAVAAGGHAVRVQGTVHHGLPGDHGVGPGPASDDLHAVVELGDRAVNPA